jgi:hypothetical protein
MGRSLNRFYIKGNLGRVFGAACLELPIGFEIHDRPPGEPRSFLPKREVNHAFGKAPIITLQQDWSFAT